MTDEGLRRMLGRRSGGMWTASKRMVRRSTGAGMGMYLPTEIVASCADADDAALMAAAPALAAEVLRLRAAISELADEWERDGFESAQYGAESEYVVRVLRAILNGSGGRVAD